MCVDELKHYHIILYKIYELFKIIENGKFLKHNSLNEIDIRLFLLYITGMFFLL